MSPSPSCLGFCWEEVLHQGWEGAGDKAGTLNARAFLRLEHGENLGCYHQPLTTQFHGSCIAMGNHHDKQLAGHHVSVGTRVFSAINVGSAAVQVWLPHL